MERIQRTRQPAGRDMDHEENKNTAYNSRSPRNNVEKILKNLREIVIGGMTGNIQRIPTTGQCFSHSNEKARTGTSSIITQLVQLYLKAKCFRSQWRTKIVRPLFNNTEDFSHAAHYRPQSSLHYR